jgi:hypothetical protein
MTSERQLYEAVGGSVPGRAHTRCGRNNQDAFAWRLDGEHALAVVCDGCSEGARSEVGAALGARLLVEVVSRALRDDPAPADPGALLARVQGEVLAGLAALCDALGGDRRRTVADYLLFTVVGVAVGRERAFAFAGGDGVLLWNGERIVLGPFPDNAPPYLGYGLLPEEPAVELVPLRELPAASLETIVLGSDGALGLELGAFLDGSCFRNPDSVRRRLTLAARTPGLLFDDTTLVALRRTLEAS